ncbi:iron complex transport system permease protein [Paenibacillus sp. BK033]|uniref:FecCD family ABC transporter permease n=1 Tax=Paenibacillus sp. BK033 TaxID=2512133 RepID=UPI0010E9CF16|nr:iron ABC transporter permease [Paenibacillus sp. BK033]TCM95666.1 iron complex transport system permease protein [Paenibacillus sp. BK033]
MADNSRLHNSQLETEPASTGREVEQLYSRPITAILIILCGLAALVLALGLSVSFGAMDIKFLTVWEAVIHFNPDLKEHQVIRELRLPRVLGCMLVGSAFAVAGAIMQGMTRNPLADSGLLGLNSGAGFALALCFAFAPGLSYPYHILFSFLGAAVSTVIVVALGASVRGGLTPMRMVLAGVTLSALLTALSEGVALYFRIGQELAFWYAGGVAGIRWEQLKIMFPWVGVALIAAMTLSRSITMLSLGEEVSKGLGLRTGPVKLAGVIIVVMLAGSAVSVAGAVSFIGLLVPHVARKLVGVDYKWIIPTSAVLGALLVVLADLAARTVHPPYETPIGTMIALIGVPFFLYLANKERREL